jgi:CRISPR-associated RAMP protein (TIGR02581 family)
LGSGCVRDSRDFDKLDWLTRICGKLVNLTPLRVGTGKGPLLGTTVDNTFLRIRRSGKEIPYIPGSTIKGVLRNYFEQLARLKYPELHDPWDQDEIEKEAKEGRFCVVCGTFGSTKIASHIRVFDAYPTSKVTTNIKTCVGIDREFQAARPAILYTEEFIEPGYEWSFKMGIINIQFPEGGDERSLLLTETIRALKLGLISFGARKSVGFGQIQLKEAKWVNYVVEEGVLKEKRSGNI